MRIQKLVAAGAATLALGAVPATPAAHAATRQFEGTIVSVNRDARSFRLRDAERGTKTIRVTSRTRYERVRGFAGLRAGMTRMEAVVRRSNGAWIATFVERSGGGGGGGGED